MKKLTPEQEIEVLELALKLIKDDFSGYNHMCYALEDAMKFIEPEIQHKTEDYSVVFEFFSDFINYKPGNKDIGKAWFSLNENGDNKRIEILTEMKENRLLKLKNS